MKTYVLGSRMGSMKDKKTTAGIGYIHFLELGPFSGLCPRSAPQEAS